MPNKLLAVIILLFSFCSSFASELQDTKATLPNEGTYLNLSITERMEVQEDVLTANLNVEKEGPDSIQVQDSINKLMSQATTKAKATSNVTVSTDQYYVYKLPSKANNTKMWHGTQKIQLQSTSIDILLKLVGELQSIGLLLQGLNYSIMPEKIDHIRDSMMEKAITNLIKQAQRVANTINKQYVGLVDINIGTNYMSDYPRPMLSANAKMVNTEMASPIAEPGKREVTITITARALLK